MAPQPNFLKTLGNGLVAMAKVWIDYLWVQLQDYIVSWNSFPIIFLWGRICEILKNYWVMRILLISSLFDVVLRARKFVNVFCCIITIGENYLRKTLIFPLFFSLFLSLFPLSLPFFLPLPSAWVFDFFPPQGGGERIC